MLESHLQLQFLQRRRAKETAKLSIPSRHKEIKFGLVLLVRSFASRKNPQNLAKTNQVSKLTTTLQSHFHVHQLILYKMQSHAARL